MIDRQLNYEYDELLSLISTAYINNSKMLACFWGLDLNNISPNRQCFQIRFFPGNNVFNNSPSNPTIEQADTTGGKHLLVEKTSHYAFSLTSSSLTFTFCTISISRHCSKLVNDLAKKRKNVTLVKSKLPIPKIQCLFLGLAYVRADDTLSSGHHHGNHTTIIFIGIIIIEAITKKFICATKVGF